MNRREMTQFIFAFLSLDAGAIEERPQFMDDLKDALRAEKGGKFSLSEAEERRLLRAQRDASARMEQLAGPMLDVFWGRD
jgi:hypothetical protein